MFSKQDLKRIEAAVSKLDKWNSVTFSKDEDSNKVLFTFTPVLSGNYDGATELEAENLDELKAEARSYAADYDPDYQTYIWLDESGHGKCGAPYRMLDVHSQMEELQDALEDLAIGLNAL